MSTFTQRVKDFARERGVDLVGIAGKECFGRLPGLRPDELLPDARSVVVIAIRRNIYVAQHRPSWHSREQYVGALAFRFMVINSIAAYLEDEGYEAFPVGGHGVFSPLGAAYRKAVKYLSVSEDGEISGMEEFQKVYFGSHRYLSYIRLGEEAGLGEFGRCSMLVTPQFGPRVGIAAVITTAELEPDGRVEEEVCLKDECSKCVEYCPSGAIKPYGYNIVKCMSQMGLLPLDMLKRGDQQEIERHLAARGVFPGSGRAAGGVCGMCMIACPIGRKYIAKPRKEYGTAIYADLM